MTPEEAVARALCLVQFGDSVIHGDARCCQVGGTDGCCLADLHEQAVAAIKAMDQWRFQAAGIAAAPSTAPVGGIVEWLRKLAKQRRSAFGEESTAGCRCEEAADEIDRLRGELDRSRGLLSLVLHTEAGASPVSPSQSGSDK